MMYSKFKLEGEDREALALLHAKASWFILECKYLYYCRDASPIEDVVYDQIEKLYEALCVHLGEQPTATDMVGFDLTRPSCEMVATKSQIDPVPRSVELMEFVQVLADTVDATPQV